MTQPGETDRFAVSDHLRAIRRHVGPVVTDVLVDSERVPRSLRHRYGEEGAEPVDVDREAIAGLGVRLHEAALQSTMPGRQVRRDPDRLAHAILGLRPTAG